MKLQRNQLIIGGVVLAIVVVIIIVLVTKKSEYFGNAKEYKEDSFINNKDAVTKCLNSIPFNNTEKYRNLFDKQKSIGLTQTCATEYNTFINWIKENKKDECKKRGKEMDDCSLCKTDLDKCKLDKKLNKYNNKNCDDYKIAYNNCFKTGRDSAGYFLSK
jgi:hypothetical protein